MVIPVKPFNIFLQSKKISILFCYLRKSRKDISDHCRMFWFFHNLQHFLVAGKGHQFWNDDKSFQICKIHDNLTDFLPRKEQLLLQQITKQYSFLDTKFHFSKILQFQILPKKTWKFKFCKLTLYKQTQTQ